MIIFRSLGHICALILHLKVVGVEFCVVGEDVRISFPLPLLGKQRVDEQVVVALVLAVYLAPSFLLGSAAHTVLVPACVAKLLQLPFELGLVLVGICSKVENLRSWN